MSSDVVTIPTWLQDHCRPHSNGGGFVAPGTDITDDVYVGPGSLVLGGTYSGYVRIDDDATVVHSSLHGNTSREPINVHGGYLFGVQIRGARTTIRDSELNNVTYVAKSNGTDLNHTIRVEYSILRGVELGGKIYVLQSTVDDFALNDARITHHAIVGKPSPYGLQMPPGTFTGGFTNAVITRTEQTISYGYNYSIFVLKEPPLGQ